MKTIISSLNSIERRAEKPFEESTALISIGNYGSKPPILKYTPSFMLRMEFDDIYPMDIDYDNISKSALRLFSLTQAEQTADFIYSHINDADTFIFQCDFGFSRSAAVAAAFKEHFYHNGISVFIDENYCPNIYVFRTVLKALNNKLTL